MKNNNVVRRVLTAAVFLALAIPSAQAQGSAASEDRITLAHKFMRALYPDLGASRTLTVGTYFPYAQEDTTISWLEVSIGEGPKDAILGYAGGCINQPPTAPLPSLPPEFGPPESSTGPSNISFSQATTNEKTKDCPSGPIRSKQFLAGSFWIGNDGRLTAYVVQSPRDLDKMNAFAGVVLAHPEMSDAEVTVALKKSGAKFGPMDKDEFVKSLPLAALKPFLGKLQVLTVGFSPLQKNRNNVAIWPDWRVKTKATRADGTEETYELMFDPFRGDLISLRLVVPGHSAETNRQ
jgi:hypothetical protein